MAGATGEGQMTRLWRHSRILGAEELRDLFVRRRSVLALTTYLLFTGLLFWGLAELQRSFSDMLGNEQRVKYAHDVAKWLATVNVPEIQRVAKPLADLPPSLLIFQLMSLMWLPTLTSLVSCDMVTVDVHRGTLRYVLLRSSRAAYYLSKLIAHFVLFAMLQLVTVAALVLLIWLSVDSFEPVRFLSTASRFYIVLLPFLFCILAATELVSGMMRRPMTALLAVNIFWILVLILMSVSPTLTPFYWKNVFGIIAPFEGLWLRSALGMLAWGCGFTALGLAAFLRREV